jgi:hypothetical protein
LIICFLEGFAMSALLTIAPTRRLITRIGRKFLFILIAGLVLFTQAGTGYTVRAAPPAEVRSAPLAAAVPPSVSLNVPSNVFLGSDVNFSVSFANPSADTPGYGPVIDIILDTTGADGVYPGTTPGVNDYDGLGTTSISASYFTVPFVLNSTMWVVPFNGSGNATHPLFRDSSGAYITVTGTPGDTLVVLRLPFGSFSPGQPAATVNVSVNMSNKADVGTPLSIQARGGYEFGYTPLDDWCCGDAASPNAIGSFTSGSVKPILYTLTKTYSGPEGEAASGPNFRTYYPLQYTVSAQIAPGLSLTGLTLTDVLPANLQYYSLVASNPGGASCLTTPNPLTTPGGSLACSFAGSVSGTASMTFDFYIPRDNASGARIIDPISGDDVTSCNNASVTASWTPFDPRDTGGGVSTNPPGCEYTLTEKSIAIQKGVANVNDINAPGNSPHDTLEYTLTFQVSDFFAFNNIVVTDIVSDGQHVDSTFTPTLQINGNTYSLAATPMLSTPLTDPVNWTYDIACNYSGGAGAECTTDNTSLPNDGTTTLTFQVSREIIQSVLDANRSRAAPTRTAARTTTGQPPPPLFSVPPSRKTLPTTFPPATHPWTKAMCWITP